MGGEKGKTSASAHSGMSEAGSLCRDERTTSPFPPRLSSPVANQMLSHCRQGYPAAEKVLAAFSSRETCRAHVLSIQLAAPRVAVAFSPTRCHGFFSNDGDLRAAYILAIDDVHRSTYRSRHLQVKTVSANSVMLNRQMINSFPSCIDIMLFHQNQHMLIFIEI